MSKVWWILPGAILSIVLVTLGIGMVLGWLDSDRDDVIALNKNMQLIGTEKMSYVYGHAWQNEDGTLLVASALEPMSRYFNRRQYISLLKLDKDANTLWEKRIPFHQTTWRDFVPFASRKLNPTQTLQIKDLTYSKGQYKLLLTRKNLEVNDTYILSFDGEGKLLGSKKVKLEIGWDTVVKAISVKNWFYICYLDKANHLLCLAKTDRESGEVIYNAMKSYKSDNLLLKTMAADSTGEEVSVVAYDSKVGTSFFRYDKLNDLKEHFRTKPQTEIPSLQNLDGKVFGAVKDDSLLIVSDLTNVQKPLIRASYNPGYKDFTPVAVQLVDNDCYACLTFINPDKAGWQRDALVLRFDARGQKTGEFLMQGKRIEHAHQMLVAADKQVYVMGYTSSVRINKGIRLFISKVKM